MSWNRRQFIQSTVHTALGSGALGNLASAAARDDQDDASGTLPQIPIVDTHQHLWDLSKFRLPWLKSADKLNRSFLPKDYLKATRGLNVVKAVYMEVDVDPDQHVAEAEYVIALCRGGELPTCAAVIGGCPGEEGFRQYIMRFKANPRIKGVRQVLLRSDPRIPFFLERTFVADVRLLGDLNMSFDLCLPPTMLGAGISLVDQCPKTRFILDHCGNADVKALLAAAAKSENARDDARRQVGQWRRDIAKFAKRKNVVCKISGIIAQVPPHGWKTNDLAQIVNHCLDCFGPERVMFGSDWPVCTRGTTYRRWVEILFELMQDRSQTEQKKLFAENAVRFYGLE